MPEVLTNVFAIANKVVKRTYAIYGGLIPPYTMTLHGERYIMPGWYKMKQNEETPDIKDIAYYPYKAKKPNRICSNIYLTPSPLIEACSIN